MDGIYMGVFWNLYTREIIICTYYMKGLLSSSQKYTFFCMKSSTHLNATWFTKHSLTVFVSSHCLYMIDVFTLNTKFTTHFLPNSSAVRCDVNWYQLWYIVWYKKMYIEQSKGYVIWHGSAFPWTEILGKISCGLNHL